MTTENLFEQLKQGASLTFNLSGTSFNCALNEKYNRQEILEQMSMESNVGELEIQFIPEKGNIHDKYALRVDYISRNSMGLAAIDIGYVPRISKVSLLQNTKTAMPLTVKLECPLNKVLYHLPLQGKVLKITGNGYGYNWGITVRIWLIR